MLELLIDRKSSIFYYQPVIKFSDATDMMMPMPRPGLVSR